MLAQAQAYQKSKHDASIQFKHKYEHYKKVMYLLAWLSHKHKHKHKLNIRRTQGFDIKKKIIVSMHMVM